MRHDLFTSGRTRSLRKLAGADMPFWLLPWLMVLLVVGTIAQREIGLYEAERIFFSSWIIWLGPLPLPGGFLTLSTLSMLLLVKFLIFSAWSWKKAGINITHLGVLVLLLGGMVTALTSSEGYITIPEKGTSSQVFDYHAREFSIHRDGQIINIINFKKIRDGQLKQTELPFRITIQNTLTNAHPVAQDREKSEDGVFYRGLAQQVHFVEGNPDKSDEVNHNVLNIIVDGISSDDDGFYSLSENLPEFPSFTIDGVSYELRLERVSETLPFSFYLNDIVRDNHLGMDMARGYKSDIVIKENGNEWPVTIRMNEPLRYRGKTFYQSSYMVDDKGVEMTVLAVVQNRGAVFPYIASILIALGLIVHLAMSRVGTMPRGKK